LGIVVEEWEIEEDKEADMKINRRRRRRRKGIIDHLIFCVGVLVSVLDAEMSWWLMK
jgi:hypothetical protein